VPVRREKFTWDGAVFVSKIGAIQIFSPCCFPVTFFGCVAFAPSKERCLCLLTKFDLAQLLASFRCRVDKRCLAFTIFDAPCLRIRSRLLIRDQLRPVIAIQVSTTSALGPAPTAHVGSIGLDHRTNPYASQSSSARL
jgi:hypothetical protein